MLKVNNVFYLYDEFIDEFPDKYVVVENADLTDDGYIICGELIAVGDLDEINDFVSECQKTGRKVHFQHTTSTPSDVYLCIHITEYASNLALEKIRNETPEEMSRRERRYYEKHEFKRKVTDEEWEEFWKVEKVKLGYKD